MNNTNPIYLEENKKGALAALLATPLAFFGSSAKNTAHAVPRYVVNSAPRSVQIANNTIRNSRSYFEAGRQKAQSDILGAAIANDNRLKRMMIKFNNRSMELNALRQSGVLTPNHPVYVDFMNQRGQIEQYMLQQGYAPGIVQSTIGGVVNGVLGIVGNTVGGIARALFGGY